MMPTSRSLALVALLAAVPAGAQQGTSPRAFQLADWYKLTTLSGPAMSPSGDRVAFTVTTVRESGGAVLAILLLAVWLGLATLSYSTAPASLLGLSLIASFLLFASAWSMLQGRRA